MTGTQINTAKRRLLLGISNVGFWVLTAAGGLAWLAPSGGAPLSQTDLFTWLLVAVGLQSLFDWVGGVILMPDSFEASKGFLRRWLRGVIAHTALLCATVILGLWSYRLSGGFCLSVLLSSLALFLSRTQILRLVSGVHIRRDSVAGTACWSAESQDPSFTGGICGTGPKAAILLPEPWKMSLTGSELKTLLQRRLWEIHHNLPARAFLFVLCWNLAGCRVGSLLLGIPGRTPESALLLQCCWMTLWSFLALLLLPTASRSAVFAADRAAAAKGCDAAAWIQKFPNLSGEDGNAKTLLQRVFYPIPSAEERLRHLGQAPALPVLGNVARTNLFLSLSTLTLLGRSVHCNVGRPELWVFPPSD